MNGLVRILLKRIVSFLNKLSKTVRDEGLGTQTRANTFDNFKYPFEDAYKDKVIDRMDQNQEMFSKLMEEKDFATLVFNAIMKEVYKRFNEKNVEGL